MRFWWGLRPIAVKRDNFEDELEVLKRKLLWRAPLRRPNKSLGTRLDRQRACRHLYGVVEFTPLCEPKRTVVVDRKFVYGPFIV